MGVFIGVLIVLVDIPAIGAESIKATIDAAVSKLNTNSSEI